MRYSQILLAIAFGGSQLYLGVEGLDCDTVTNVGEDVPKLLELHTRDQLDSFEGCTTLNGHIIIQSDYEGDFILNDVTEFHGNISTAQDSPKALSRFEMRGLEKVENIHLLGLAGDISLPKLEVAGNMELVQTSDSGTVDLRVLSEANDLSIRGSWTSTDLSLLKTVTVNTRFCGSQTCAIYGDTMVFPYILVNLPSLEKTNFFEVAGTVKSVSVPKLEVVGYIEQTELTELVHSKGLRINIEEGYDETLDFDAPNLHTLSGRLEVYGGVSSLSLGSLGKTDLGITLNARAPLDVYSTIQTADFLDVWGELNSIYLPDMDDLGEINLYYSPYLSCNDTLNQLWLTQSNYSSEWVKYNSCRGYDFLQSVGVTGLSTTTRSATTTAAVTSGTSSEFGNTGSMGEGDWSGSATVSAAPTQSNETGSNSPDSTDVATQGNGTHRTFSITFIVGATPLIMAVIWASLY